MVVYHALSGSAAEDLFIDLFSETFGAEKAGYLYSQYPFFDIYQNSRYADFLLENGGRKVAIEIDDETSHNKWRKYIRHFLKVRRLIQLTLAQLCHFFSIMG